MCQHQYNLNVELSTAPVTTFLGGVRCEPGSSTSTHSVVLDVGVRLETEPLWDWSVLSLLLGYSKLEWLLIHLQLTKSSLETERLVGALKYPSAFMSCRYSFLFTILSRVNYLTREKPSPSQICRYRQEKIQFYLIILVVYINSTLPTPPIILSLSSPFSSLLFPIFSVSTMCYPELSGSIPNTVILSSSAIIRTKSLYKLLDIFTSSSPISTYCSSLA